MSDLEALEEEYFQKRQAILLKQHLETYTPPSKRDRARTKELVKKTRGTTR